MRAEAAARSRSGRTGAAPGGPPSTTGSQAGTHRPRQLLEPGRVRRRTRPDEEVTSAGPFRCALALGGKPFRSQDLAKATLQPIALDDRPAVLRNHDADPRGDGSRRSHEHVEGTTGAAIGSEHLADLARTAEAGGWWIRTAAGHGAGRRSGLTAMLAADLVTDRQRVTALLASPGQHLTTSLRLHTSSEAMILQALPAAGISVCRLHLGCLRSTAGPNRSGKASKIRRSTGSCQTRGRVD